MKQIVYTSTGDVKYMTIDYAEGEITITFCMKE